MIVWALLTYIDFNKKLVRLRVNTFNTKQEVITSLKAKTFDEEERPVSNETKELSIEESKEFEFISRKI